MALDDRISLDEIKAMFGDQLPIEAAKVLLDPRCTPVSARAALARISEMKKPLAVAREIVAAISDGWGDAEDERVAHEVASIIARRYGGEDGGGNGNSN